MSSKSVLVTGGGGFIGRHLVRKLLNRAQEVEVVDKVSRPNDFSPSRRLSYRRLDLQSVDSSLLGKPGARIVHLAAHTSVEQSVQRPLLSVRANIEGTCRMLELARKLDSDRFIFASTAAVYGDKKSRCLEQDVPDPASPYGSSKLACEYYCKVYAKLYGIRTIVLRYFNVYGPGQSNSYAGVITRFVKGALRGKPPIIFGDGSQTRDFVYVDDVIDATLACLSQRLPAGTILNIGTGKATSIKTLARLVVRLFDLKLRPVHAPPRAGDILHNQANISRARKMIHYHPSHTLEEGLPPTIRWLRAAELGS